MITLTPKPLNELAVLTDESNVCRREQAQQLDESWPGWRAEADAVLAEDDDDPNAWLKRAALKQARLEGNRATGGLSREALLQLKAIMEKAEAEDGKLTLEKIFNQAPLPPLSKWDKKRGLEMEPVRAPAKEYEEAAWMGFEWMPFAGYCRLSPDGLYQVIWGKIDNALYRVGVLSNGQCCAWFESSARIVEGWVSNAGYMALKAHVSEDDVEFAFAELDGYVFHRWQRSWRFLTFLRFNGDGMGYAYHDDGGTHEVRFVAD